MSISDRQELKNTCLTHYFVHNPIELGLIWKKIVVFPHELLYIYSLNVIYIR